MNKPSKRKSLAKKESSLASYEVILSEIVDLLESARRASARTVNAIMTATYWEIGRRIVELEQGGRRKANYGEQLVEQLSKDLMTQFGRGFGRRNLFQMRAFYLAYPDIVQTASAQLRLPDSKQKDSQIPQGLSADTDLSSLAHRFSLSWSHYVALLAVKNPHARTFYETEALRGGWSVRQLSRQINTMFYERTALSRNKAAMLTKGAKPKPEDAVTPEEEIKDPFVLEVRCVSNAVSLTESGRTRKEVLGSTSLLKVER
jgi:hypothetical protein